MSLELTVGADPEFFLVNQKTGKLTAACGLIGGTKKEPLPITTNTKIQEDGVAVELNTLPVVHDIGSNALYDQARVSYLEAQEFVRGKYGMLSLWIVPEAEFDEDQLLSEQARTFGCDPDLNAHMEGMQNPLIEADAVGRERFCGGHIHFGYDTSKVEMPDHCLVQLCDAMITAPEVYNNQECTGVRRAKFYGRAGAFRKKPYGFEYRVPSPNWIKGGQYARRLCDFVHWAINNQSQARLLYENIIFPIVTDQMNSHAITSDLVDYLMGLEEKYVRIPKPEKPKAPRLRPPSLADYAQVGINRIRVTQAVPLPPAPVDALTRDALARIMPDRWVVDEFNAALDNV